MGWCRAEGNEMVWDGGSETPVVSTRWALLEVALGRAPVWPCGGGQASRRGASEGVLSVTSHSGSWTKDVIISARICYPGYETSPTISIFYSKKIIRNIFGVWNWNINIVCFFLDPLRFLELKFDPLCAYGIYVTFKQTKCIVHLYCDVLSL